MCFKEKIETIRFFYSRNSWTVPAYSTRHLLHAGVPHGREDCLRPIISRYEFNKCVERYQGHHRVRQFSCWDQYLAMALAQVTGRDSLRDVEVCLQSQRDRLYRMDFRGRVSRSRLTDANANRSFLIYQDFGLHLIARARGLYQHEPFALDLKHVVLVLDSTTIDLCLSVFPWVHFRTTKAAVKAHTPLDLRGSIPTFVALTSAKVHDVLALDWIPLEPGSILTMDRAYNDFDRLYRRAAQEKTSATAGAKPIDRRTRPPGCAATS